MKKHHFFPLIAVTVLIALFSFVSSSHKHTTVHGPWQACFKCGGSGRLHWSKMEHKPGCIFCTTCNGCDGTGNIPNKATRCPKCGGQGRIHNSTMEHTPDCIFCSNCGTCSTKGYVIE